MEQLDVARIESLGVQQGAGDPFKHAMFLSRVGVDIIHNAAGRQGIPPRPVVHISGNSSAAPAKGYDRNWPASRACILPGRVRNGRLRATPWRGTKHVSPPDRFEN
ncbi:hypothetical protein NtRootA9_16360 [Arthrobacter sp. NtRootA9]|nr:hypothetical protein NtRootA9_16360 [Arthrobacter sp. NtRootA9]